MCMCQSCSWLQPSTNEIQNGDSALNTNVAYFPSLKTSDSLCSLSLTVLSRLPCFFHSIAEIHQLKEEEEEK